MHPWRTFSITFTCAKRFYVGSKTLRRVVRSQKRNARPGCRSGSHRKVDGNCHPGSRRGSGVQSLQTFAERGRVVPEIDAPDIRELFIRSYRLLYQVTADRVFILAFVHGARDLTALWERRGGPRETSP